jgi:sugar/nucleoside kinase (ribokinase family)
MVVVTLGDLLLDVIVRLAEPLADGADATASTRIAPGGQAANVAAWAAAAAATARCVAHRGADPPATWLTAELAARGVDVLGPAGGGTGVVVSLVAADGDRTMASDRASGTELAPDDLEPSWFACDWLHLSGYALVASPVDAAAGRAAEHARAHGARVSVDLSAWTRIRDHGAGRLRELLARIAPDVVFGDEREWDEIGDVGVTRVVKRGAAGFDVVRGETVDRCQAPDVAVVDTTGAGDALAAGFLVGGPELARQTAAHCVAQVGAMP